jgi:hypothetical protein
VIEGPGGGLVIAPNGDIWIGMEPTILLKEHDKSDLFIAGRCISTSLQAEIASISGSLSAGTLSTNSATINGLLQANSASIVGSLSARDATIANTLTARNASITGTATVAALIAQNAAINIFGAQSATITNTLTAGTLSATNANITNLTGTTTANNFKVTGLLCAKEVRVQLSGNPCWPDYVFAEDYHLLPLSEVEQFINQNHHLPKIPSAAQVEANGIELGEMNALLLLKVEELTLYLLQQEKKMLDLQKQIDELKNSKP